MTEVTNNIEAIAIPSAQLRVFRIFPAHHADPRRGRLASLSGGELCSTRRRPDHNRGEQPCSLQPVSRSVKNAELVHQLAIQRWIRVAGARRPSEYRRPFTRFTKLASRLSRRDGRSRVPVKRFYSAACTTHRFSSPATTPVN